MPERRSLVGQTRSLTVNITRAAGAAADASGIEVAGLTVTGHAAVFDSVSQDMGFFEKVARGAFRKALKRGDDVRFLINHEGLPLARTTNGTLTLAEDPVGLNVVADLADITASRELVTLIERGDVTQMSFMFTIAKEEWTLGADGEPDIVTITEIGNMYDVSAVTFPAYAETDICMKSNEPQTSSRAREAEPTQVEAVDEAETLQVAEPCRAPEGVDLGGARRRLVLAETYLTGTENA